MSFIEKIQELCKEIGARFYGDGGTIHGTKHLDVEVGPDGKVCAVWFRCQPLPFEHCEADESRAREMKQMYDSNGSQLEMNGVVLTDPKQKKNNKETNDGNQEGHQRTD